MTDMTELPESPPISIHGDANLPSVSFVVIGHNEGPRLRRCLESLQQLDYPTARCEIIYADSHSTDDSCAIAEALGARVVRSDAAHRTAAAARNAGLHAANCDLVHFFDGDTVVDRGWLRTAAAAMVDDETLCVFGRCEEMKPRANLYHFWAHHDWYRAPGPADAAGGIALFRRGALEKVGGFDAALVAGEEPDLCHRLRREVGGVIRCIDAPMVLHDINMASFGQYWRRCMRTGLAYAQVADRHPDMHAWRRARWRNLGHALAGPVAALASLALWSPWPIAIWAALLTAAWLRNAARVRPRVGSWSGALLYALHHYLAKTPMALGQMGYWLRRHGKQAPQPVLQ